MDVTHHMRQQLNKLRAHTCSDRLLILGFIVGRGSSRSRNFITSPAWYSSLSRLYTQHH